MTRGKVGITMLSWGLGVLTLGGGLMTGRPGSGEALALTQQQPTLEARDRVAREVEEQDLITVDVINLGRDVSQITCQLATVAPESRAESRAGEELKRLAARGPAPTDAPQAGGTTRRVSARVDDGRAACQFPGVAAGLYRLDVLTTSAGAPRTTAAAGSAGAQKVAAAAFLPFIGRHMKIRIILGR
jgi:hypothetical protein